MKVAVVLSFSALASAQLSALGSKKNAPKAQSCIVGQPKDSPLPPCAKGFTCEKVDSGCFDLQVVSGKGGCLGTCVDHSLLKNPLAQSSPVPKLPWGSASPPAPAWGGAPPPAPAAPASGGNPWGSNGGAPPSTGWGNKGGNPAPAPAAPAWNNGPPPSWNNAPTPAPASGSHAHAPRPAPQPARGQTPQNFGACPPNIQCPNRNVCSPDPRKQSTFLCFEPKDTCGSSRACTSNKICVADGGNPSQGYCL